MNPKVIGQKLKLLRKRKKYKVEKIVKLLNKYNIFYTIQSVYKWEEGVALPNIYILSILCDIYNCDMTYLIEENITTEKNLTASEIFLLNQYRFNDDIRAISNILYKVYKKTNN